MGLEVELHETCKQCGVSFIRPRRLLDNLGVGWVDLLCEKCREQPKEEMTDDRKKTKKVRVERGLRGNETKSRGVLQKPTKKA